ncbi:type I restriction enzyme HsdR N-terminal domain-containing protein [Haloferula sp. A504]|uniref:type I restriction enzyme HsdR N-terminal domain-containing protein n=1 Tax=Haloferula sp. A504 TaxID=3373601 RepID=UPI0031C9BEE2|nr:type I restriction enzyme HsdR N-terminal domain-containing protein [Verrucomicrobiaceae bacterium E54]
MRRCRYTVPETAYLFPEKVRVPSEKKRNLEEPVRQWCAHELLRAYGFPVLALEFEHPVKVGSKTYGIDILVTRDGIPWIVVECKEPEDRKPEKAIDQAKSYASAESIQAEWAVASNGGYWRVERKVRDSWFTVPDIIPWDRREMTVPVTDLLRFTNSVAPLLEFLENDKSQTKPPDFFESLHTFFDHLLHEGAASRELLLGADMALRPLVGDFRPEYRLGKLASAAQNFSQYRSKLGLEGMFPEVLAGGKFAEELHAVTCGISRLREEISAGPSLDGLILALLEASLGWAYSLEKGATGQLPPPPIHSCLRDLLDAFVSLSHGVSLPRPSDSLGMAGMRILAGQRVCDS